MLLTLFIVSMFVLLAVLTFFRNVIFALLHTFFSLFSKKGRRAGGGTSSAAEGNQKVHRSSKNRSKVYSSDDGEYVDFEEVEK